YDSIIIDTLSGDVPPKQPAPYVLPAGQLVFHAATGAAARAPVRSVGRARFRTPGKPAVDLAATTWAIAPLDGGPPVAARPPPPPSGPGATTRARSPISTVPAPPPASSSSPPPPSRREDRRHEAAAPQDTHPGNIIAQRPPYGGRTAFC